MRVEKDIIIAVELGSTAIRAIAGKKEPDGTMQVLAIAQEKATNSIRKGVVDNIDKTTQAISRVVKELNDRLGIYTKRIYVGLGGQSLKTMQNQVPYKLTEKTQISNELVDQLKDINSSVIYPDCDILEAIPQEYRVGSRSGVQDPVGMQCEQIEAKFVNLVANKSLAENIETCVNNAGLELAELLISPICLADCLLSVGDKRSGCALVDIGADTTTVSVYTENTLRHLVVIPIGGSSVTADVASETKDQEEAEQLKLKYGTAYHQEAEEAVSHKIELSHNRDIEEEKLQYIIEARYEEIIANVWNHIEAESDALLSGIILTGGASRVKDLTLAFAKHIVFATKHTDYKKQIRIAKGLPVNITLGTNVHISEDDNLYTLMGLLLKGNETCIGEAPKKVETEVVQGEIPFDTPPTENEPEVIIPETEEAEATAESEETHKKPSEGVKKKMRSFWDKITEMLSEPE